MDKVTRKSISDQVVRCLSEHYPAKSSGWASKMQNLCVAIPLPMSSGGQAFRGPLVPSTVRDVGGLQSM